MSLCVRVCVLRTPYVHVLLGNRVAAFPAHTSNNIGHFRALVIGVREHSVRTYVLLTQKNKYIPALCKYDKYGWNCTGLASGAEKHGDPTPDCLLAAGWLAVWPA